MPDFNTPVTITTPGDAALVLTSTNNPGSTMRLEAVTSNGVTEAQLQFQNKFRLVAPLGGKDVLVATQDGSVQLGPYAADHPNPPGRLTVSGPENQAIVVLSTDAKGDPVGSQTRLLSVVSNGVDESQLQFMGQFSLVPLGAPNGAGPSLTHTYDVNTGKWQLFLKDNPGKSAFIFNSQSVTFPDGTVQMTAFQRDQIEAQIANLQAQINDLQLQIAIDENR
jgi:hypothetical protein